MHELIQNLHPIVIAVIIYFSSFSMLMSGAVKGLFAKLTKNEHVVIAISGTRVYFKEASPAEGFKLTCFNKSRSNCNFRVSTDIVPLSEKGVELGDYRLMFDPMVKLYYIDIAKKIRYE